MRGIILLISFIVYIAVGYFVSAKIGNFIDNNYKEYDYKMESKDENDKTQEK